MDATCKVQDNIHVFRLVHNMCPGFWVHIKLHFEVFLFEKTSEVDDLLSLSIHIHFFIASSNKIKLQFAFLTIPVSF